MKKPCSILIIDDNPDDIFMTKRAISKSRNDCVARLIERAAEVLNK